MAKMGLSRFLGGALLALAITAAGTPAHAALVLDQGNVASPVTLQSTFSFRPGAYRRVQTFTVGVSGVLEQIRVQLADTAVFQGLSLYSTVNGVPTRQVLGTGSYAATEDGFALFDVSLAVTAGQVLAFDPYTGEGQRSVGWAGTNRNSYAGGVSFVSIDSGVSFASEGYDQGFQTLVRTVDAAAVPEPATWATMLLGLGAAGAAMRRRRRSVAAVA